MKTEKNNIYLITLVACIGGLLFGYDTAVISGAVGALDQFFIQPVSKDSALSSVMVLEFKIVLTLCIAAVIALIGSFLYKIWSRKKATLILAVFLLVGGFFYYSYFVSLPNSLSVTLQNSILGFMVSSALVGCIIGAALGDRIANTLGRRNGLLIAAFLFFLSALGSGYPDTINFFGGTTLTSFIIYRLIGGVGVGLASMLTPLYIAEMAPANTRGKLVSFNQLAIVFGMLLVYFVNYYIVKGQEAEWINTIGWRNMFLSECIPAALFFFLLFTVPKTPRFEVMKGREEKAVRTLTKLNGENRASAILQQIKKSFGGKKAHWLSYGWGIILVGIMLSVFQQFVGINVVLYYAPEIFKGMGLESDASYYQTIIVGSINMLFTLVAIFTVDSFGRKKLLIIGSVIMAISMIGLGFSLYSQLSGMTPLLMMLLYIAAFAMSWGPVTWVLLSEIFPNKIKGAMAIAVAFQWIANLAVSWTFPMMNNHIGLTELFHHGFAYWIYGIMAILSVIFVWKFIPETKGKSLEEMEQFWEPQKS